MPSAEYYVSLYIQCIKFCQYVEWNLYEMVCKSERYGSFSVFVIPWFQIHLSADCKWKCIDAKCLKFLFINREDYWVIQDYKSLKHLFLCTSKPIRCCQVRIQVLFSYWIKIFTKQIVTYLWRPLSVKSFNLAL